MIEARTKKCNRIILLYIRQQILTEVNLTSFNTVIINIVFAILVVSLILFSNFVIEKVN